MISHVLGRIYICPQGHEIDDVEAPVPMTDEFLGDPPDEIPCTACDQRAALKFYGEQHGDLEPCPLCIKPDDMNCTPGPEHG